MGNHTGGPGMLNVGPCGKHAARFIHGPSFSLFFLRPSFSLFLLGLSRNNAFLPVQIKCHHFDSGTVTNDCRLVSNLHINMGTATWPNSGASVDKHVMEVEVGQEC